MLAMVAHLQVETVRNPMHTITRSHTIKTNVITQSLSISIVLTITFAGIQTVKTTVQIVNLKTILQIIQTIISSIPLLQRLNVYHILFATNQIQIANLQVEQIAVRQLHNKIHLQAHVETGYF